MKQTAVQWLETILEGQKDKPFDFDEWSIAFEHAKEMEKEQIMDAYTADCDTLGHTNAFKVAAEQYYNETYSSGRTESVKSE